jgi:hypothetical protein
MSAARDQLDTAMSERDLQRMVLDLARLTGWRVHHTLPAMQPSGRWITPLQGDAGLPDLLLVKGGRLLALELKAQRRKPTDAQRAWLADLGSVPGVVARVIRPSDWPEVVQLLQGAKP